MLHVEAMRDEIVGERGQERGVARWVGRSKVVNGIDDASSEQMKPDSIDLSFRETAVVRAGQPVSDRE